MGIDTWRDPSRFGLALSLGGGETTLLDLAQVYGVLASGGYRIEPVPFSKIVDSKEREVSFSTSKTKVLDPGISYIISDILSDNGARKIAFGSGSALEIPGYKVSVKTGTTDEKKDNLAVGYTPEFLVAVWVGNNDNTPMNQQLVSGITGAAPIWNKMMRYLLTTKSKGTPQMEKPDNVIGVPCGGRTEYFLIGTEKNAYCGDSIIKPKDKDDKKQEARKPEDKEENEN
jgi:membrane peptidoglycan carboxypeptidase